MKDISDDPWNPHNLSASETLRRLNSSQEGLSQEEVEERLEKYGSNKLRREEGRTPLEMFLSEFKSPLVLLLLGAFILTVALHEYTDATVIGVIIVLNSGIGFIQEYRAEKTLEALKEMLEPTTTVVRNSELMTISAEKLVPGDILVLEPGQRVPADARLIDAVRLQTQEAPLTGESTPVSKMVEGSLPEDTPIADRKNMILMGTTIVKGTGRAVVTHTGMESEFGGVSQEVQLIEKEETPLMRRLMTFSKKLSIAALSLMVLAVSVELYQTGDLVLALMTAVALSLSAVPEGLPAVITIMLSLGMKNMAEKNAIVRRLSSVEGLGSTTVICADKTGTMTEDEMTVRKVYVDDKDINVSGKGYKPEGDFTYTRGNPQQVVTEYPVKELEEETPFKLMLRIFALCNNTSINYDAEKEEWRVIGDPTEGALTILAQKGGLVKEDIMELYPEIQENPFTPARKMMSTIHKTPSGDRVAYIKGAPETVLEHSTHIYEDGEVKKLTSEKRVEIQEHVAGMTENALRVLAAAYKDVEEEEYGMDAVEDNLVFVGIAGMHDPPRENVRESIAMCRTAGIKVKMITGDHLKTAMAVAIEIGLIEQRNLGVALTGREVNKMSDEELQEAVKRVKVFARVSPDDKRRIASALQANGEIVAMTGDGVNDAPAVKQADIGISMGEKGTEVTKEASDMVLSDDNFSTIVTAVGEGRKIYGNIRTFLRYFLTSNIDEILIIGIGAFFALHGHIPLLPLQILWINLATDGLVGTMLVFDTYDEDVMQLPPRDPDEGLLSGMELFIFVVAALQSIAGLSIFFLGLYTWNLPYPLVNTMVFVETILFELFSVWNCRSERHSVWARGRDNFRNKWLVVGVLLNVVLTLLLVYFPPLQRAFSTTPLKLEHWVIVTLFSSLGLFHLPELLIQNPRT